jgi:hypothetical protein
LVAAVCAAGILPLNDGYLSDHRALVVDFDPMVFFGGKTSEIVAPSSRRLTSTNPKAVHEYIKFMKGFIAQHRIAEQVDELRAESIGENEWGDEQIAKYEKIDRLLSQGQRAAEKKCPAKRSGQYPWSLEFEKARKLWLYWRLCTREITSKFTNLLLLTELAQSLNIPAIDQEWQDSKTVFAKCRAAKKGLAKVKREAAALREQHLQDMAKLASSLHHTSEKAARSAIAWREKTARQFNEARPLLNGVQSGGMDQLEILDKYAVLQAGEETPRIPLVLKEEIEEVLLPHTEQRFCQHQETPFGRGEQQRALGHDCTSTDVQDILQGSYDRELEKISEEAREWICQLRTKQFVQDGGAISTFISTADWITGWAKMRESTASAPGGHYGHYKMASVAARLPEEHPNYYYELARIYALMCSLPLKHGFSPSRWCSCVDAILEKIPGQPRLEKLRIIMLYEADFNFVLKLIWGKRLVRNAEYHKVLGTSNHGSRPGWQCADALMEKLLNLQG